MPIKLHYYLPGDAPRNFGDDLNSLIFGNLLSGSLSEDSKVVMTGIGTLLNDRLANTLSNFEKIIVFSSGAGYGNPPKINSQWDVRCVRGPLTLRKLGLKKNIPLGDGAYLVNEIIPIPNVKKEFPFSYMPHFRHSGMESWRIICQELGINFIDPTNESEIVISNIDRSEIVITEAMHGAIVADARRVPWIPISSNKYILPFKWNDWCASINQEYQPVKVASLRGRTPIEKALMFLQGSKSKRQLLEVTKSGKAYLSTDHIANQIQDDLLSSLQKLKEDIPNLCDT